jgi:hypothetical protein
MISSQDIATASDNDDHTVDERLAALSPSLSTRFIHDIVSAAYDPYVNSLGGFQPANGKGAVLQIYATDLLRGRLCAMGWEKSDRFQVPCIIDMEYGIRLCCSTDGGASVGREGSIPVLRTKGSGTLHLAGCEGNMTLPIPELECLAPEALLTRIDSFRFYYLLMHIDEPKYEIRMEVSTPVFDDRGGVSKWADRIILPPLSLARGPLVSTPEVPKPEIPVKKRKAS